MICAGVKARLGEVPRPDHRRWATRTLKAGMRAIFDASGVDYDFAGFIPHDSLPDYYAQAKLLLLPTSGDCWGVVLNEAMLAGSPVITTDMTRGRGRARSARARTAVSCLWISIPGSRRSSASSRMRRSGSELSGERPEPGPGVRLRSGRGGDSAGLSHIWTAIGRRRPDVSVLPCGRPPRPAAAVAHRSIS
ncbi:MAG: glycosyltransferase [Candidatus Moduliflexus flocculans]|nr:glycosyltransferase [Candidatus Moduliflexus flocculans]